MDGAEDHAGGAGGAGGAGSAGGAGGAGGAGSATGSKRRLGGDAGEPPAKKARTGNETPAVAGARAVVRKLTKKQKDLEARLERDGVTNSNLKTLLESATAELNVARSKLQEARLAAQAGVPQPVAMPAHPSTVAYWKNASEKPLSADGAMAESYVVAGADLVLPEDLYGADEIGLSVRASYVVLVDEILRFAKHTHSRATTPGYVSNVGVYGTPGIGKSVFASYLVGALGALCRGDTVMYTAGQSRSSGRFLAFFPDGRVEYLNAEAGRRLLSDVGGNAASGQLVWLIVDGEAPPQGALVTLSRVRIVTVSSANLEKKGWLKEWDKHTHLRLLMPPFTSDEVMAAAARRVVDAAEGERLLEVQRATEARDSLLRSSDACTPGVLEAATMRVEELRDATTTFKRFAVFGGSPRLIFGSDSPSTWMSSMMPSECGPAYLYKLLNDHSEGSATEDTTGNSRILHLFPRPADAVGGSPVMRYDDRVARFASHRVEKEIVDKLLRGAKDQVELQLSMADAFQDSYVVSLLFEPIMHARIIGGGAFKDAKGAAVALPHPASSRLFAATEPHLVFGAAAGCYMRPLSKVFPSVDSFLKLPGHQGVLLFQKTGQESHPINMPGLLELFSVPAGTPDAVEYRDAGGKVKHVLVPDRTVLYFVVMPRRLPGFKVKQPFVGRSNGKPLECTQNPEMYVSTRIRQEVIASAEIGRVLSS